MIDLGAIEKRCDAAMKGPWSVGKYGIGEWEVIPVARGQYWGIFVDRANAEFIACARDDIPGLVAEVEQLRDEVASLRGAIEEVAIPSLLYCEKMYDHDDMARMCLEANVTKNKRETEDVCDRGRTSLLREIEQEIERCKRARLRGSKRRDRRDICPWCGQSVTEKQG